MWKLTNFDRLRPGKCA